MTFFTIQNDIHRNPKTPTMSEAPEASEEHHAAALDKEAALIHKAATVLERKSVVP